MVAFHVVSRLYIGSAKRLSDLSIDALVESNTKRPPIDFASVATSFEHFWREVGQRAGFAFEHMPL